MANLYDVSDHPLLSDDARLLEPNNLDAQARVAETLLGLLLFSPFNRITDADKYNRASDAVALQVSYQVEAGLDAFILSELIKGGRQTKFRGGRRMPIIHGVAKKIVSQIRPRDTVTSR